MAKALWVQMFSEGVLGAHRPSEEIDYLRCPGDRLLSLLPAVLS